MAPTRPTRRPRAEVLRPRALNRAVLNRQLLLRRADLPVTAAVEAGRLVTGGLPRLAVGPHARRAAVGVTR